MASTVKWEVVGKPVKKTKAQTQNGRQGKKVLGENAPRTEFGAVPKDSTPTIYDAFAEKERQERLKQTGKEQVKPKPEANGKKPQHKPKPKQQHDKPKGKKTLEQALQQIGCSDLETLLLKDKTTFPDNPSVWLKDLAAYLNVKLDCVAEPDPVFEGKPQDYPESQLPDPIRKILMDTLKQCTPRTLELFMEHCVQSMINDMSKGISTYGFRIFLQLLALQKPNVTLPNLDRYLEMLKANQNRQLRCLSIMWAVGQCGMKDLASGLKVWNDLMIPLLGVRALSGYAVAYLEKLFSVHTNLSSGFGALGFREFFPILDVIFSTNSNLPTNLQKNLLSLYPKLKVIAFGDQPSAILRNFFPSFLARITPNGSPQMQAEILSSLLTCLSVDKQCYSVWRQMYTKHMYQSSVFLEYLLENWDKASGCLERNLVKETIRAFSITNEELATQGKTSMEGYQKSVDSCKGLLAKMAWCRFPWFSFFLLSFMAIAGLLAYDVHRSHGFKNSKTSQFLENAGVMVFAEQAYSRVKLYGGKSVHWVETHVPKYFNQSVSWVETHVPKYFNQSVSDSGGQPAVVVGEKASTAPPTVSPEPSHTTHSDLRWLQVNIPYYSNYTIVWLQVNVPNYFIHTKEWLQENVPYYYGQACEFLEPYLLLCWNGMVAAWLWLAEATRGQRDWLSTKIPQLLEWVESNVPGLLSSVLHYGTLVWSFVVEYSLWLWHHLVAISTAVVAWLYQHILQGNFSPDAIMSSVSSSVVAVQNYTISAWHWCMELIGNSSK